MSLDSTYLFKVSAHLLSFKCGVEKLKLEEELEIRKLSSQKDFRDYQVQLRQAIVDTDFPIDFAFAPVDPKLLDGVGLGYVIEFPYRLDLPEGESLKFHQYVEKIPLIITALRLFKKGLVGVSDVSIKIVEGPYYVGALITTPVHPMFHVQARDGYQLDEADKFVEFYNELKKYLPPKTPQLHRAIRWFNKAYGEAEEEDKFIDHIVALESLYESRGYQLSLRCAYNIGIDQKEREEIIEVLRKSSRVRGAILHGGESKEDEMRQFGFKAEDYARKSILKFLKGPNHKRLLTQIDKAIIGGPREFQ